MSDGRDTFSATRRDLLRWMGTASVAALTADRIQAAALPRETYRDQRAPVDLRVRDLMRRMTLEEKVAQTISLWATKADVMRTGGTEFDPRKASAAYPAGFGQVTRPSDLRGGPSVASGAI
jgi:beta-glucosidase